MAVLKPRERLVYFRISEDEYRRFTSVCEESGARSVSDLARNAVQRLIDEGQRHQQQDQMEEKLRLLEHLIAEVKEQLQLLGADSARENHTVAVGNGADRFVASDQLDQYGRKEG